MSHTAEVKGVGVGVSEEGIGGAAVILEAREEVLPIFVDAGQAQSIERARQGLPSERPMTHDLLVDMITEFGGAIDKIRIDDIADGTFYAKIDAEQITAGDRHQFVFDARPSDAIALAIRVGCPVTVTDNVLDTAGHPADEIDLNKSDDRDPPFSND